MKIIISNGLVKYAFPDSYQITLADYSITTPNFVINDLNVNNATLMSAILNVPADFVGNKYTYSLGAWLLSGIDTAIASIFPEL